MAAPATTVTTTGTGLRFAAVTGDDQISGGTEADVLLGYAGNDTIYGGGGLDTMDGGAGKARVRRLFVVPRTLNTVEEIDLKRLMPCTRCSELLRGPVLNT